MKGEKDARRFLCLTNEKSNREYGNILILGIGAWFVILAFAFAVMAAGDLYIDKRDLAAEADYIALSIADDIDESSYYGDASSFYLPENELLRRASELIRHDSEIVHLFVRPDGSVHIQLKRTVSVFAISALTNVGNVELYASSTAYLREYDDL